MFNFLKPYLFTLDPEVAHDLAIKSLKFNIIPENMFTVKDEHMLETEFLKKKIKNPIGLAAGFDKSAEVYNSLFKLGYGFVEVGTVTPKKQMGNPKPRVFRLEQDEALINRLGFNNDGLEIVKNRVINNKANGILGINIGPNKDSKDKVQDYITCLQSIHNTPDYITINISSPNTKGLRDFHDDKSLTNLLNKVEKTKIDNKISKSIFLKISADIEEKDISNLIENILKFKIDGLIISNTTDKNRNDLVNSKKSEAGGLSGKPLQNISNNLIKKFFKETNGKLTIIGVGGVDSGYSAFDKITLGANLVQLYTGMIYKGPGIVKSIKKDLIKILKKEKIKKIEDCVGINS